MADYDEFATSWYRDRAQEGAEKAIDKKLSDEWHTNWIRDRAQEGAQKALQPISEKLDQIIQLLNK